MRSGNRVGRGYRSDQVAGKRLERKLSNIQGCQGNSWERKPDVEQVSLEQAERGQANDGEQELNLRVIVGGDVVALVESQ